ncbi:antibiotic biosynthesis monooxygenase [Actinoplanes sp. NBRC 14428]|uniref:Quinol monooxygenase YgiN n=1 Tax=Pseudosporangium ferrugineum TaxID=439699 RepID=A0A2T0S205_9ACTN|nr:putative quinol monooxygenase [Pseudosporangium ferrugineum]PRY27454.1 quinol monooxygenase YgiN [Pseudosporangium ferrugineum]BCJ55787.1 antibiotic biosynthesis monooxygenase [Actinoplanes sp. NBRC 14428]
MAYGYIGTMRTVQDHRDEVVRILLSGTQGLRAAGCLLYVVSVSDSDSELIHVTEVWQSREHHDASLRLPETQAAIAQAMPLLTGEFTREELTVVGGLGLA